MDWEADVDEALQALKDAAPTFLSDVPELKPLAGFLPLFGIALQAVSTVQSVHGSSVSEAVGHVASTLTPGAPSTPALAPDAAPWSRDTASQIAAVEAAAAPSDSATVQKLATDALTTLPGTPDDAA